MNSLAQLPWTEQKKIAAWTACRPLDGHSPAEYRVDAYGNLIVWSHHGKQGEHGWEVDHVVALALGGTDNLGNLRALHWRKNRQLGGHVGNALSMTRGPLNGSANAVVNAFNAPNGMTR